MRNPIFSIEQESEFTIYLNEKSGLIDLELDNPDATLDVSLSREEALQLISKLMEVL